MATQKILIIEDDQALVKSLSRRLEAAGYEVDSVSDGFAALEKIHNEKPNLVILDLMLPEVDGYKVCRMLKFDEAYKDTPVIMLTGRTQEEDRNKGLRMGADAYIIKPFENRELLRKIEELLAENNTRD